MSRTTVDLKGYLENELRMRYSPGSILPYNDNEIIHEFFKGPISAEKAKTFKVMNPNIQMMAYSLIKHIPLRRNSTPESLDNPLTQHLLDELGLRPTAEDFQKIRERKLKMCVVGYGGAMVNMLYNMYTWAMELSETGIFEKVAIYEKDTIDFSNLMRMGKPLGGSYHSGFTNDYDEEVPTLKTLKKLNMFDIEKELSAERVMIKFSKWLQADSAALIDSKDYFFVGAPTLETRNMLSDKKFFFLGHSNYEVDITYSPQGISSLAVETYGTIDIPVLLINLQLATAAFIKILASGEEHQPDERLLDFDLKEWVENNPEKMEAIYG